MNKDEQIQELKNDCKRLAAELDYIGVADEELMYPELYKKYLREPEQSLKTRPHEMIVMRLKWPDVHFVIKYMVENINTERIDVNDQYGIEKLTDTVFSEYQNWKNKKEA